MQSTAVYPTTRRLGKSKSVAKKKFNWRSESNKTQPPDNVVNVVLEAEVIAEEDDGMRRSSRSGTRGP